MCFDHVDMACEGGKEDNWPHGRGSMWKLCAYIGCGGLEQYLLGIDLLYFSSPVVTHGHIC